MTARAKYIEKKFNVSYVVNRGGKHDYTTVIQHSFLFCKGKNC